MSSGPLPRTFAGEGGTHRTPPRGGRWEGEGVRARSSITAEAAARASRASPILPATLTLPTPAAVRQVLGPSLSREAGEGVLPHSGAEDPEVIAAGDLAGLFGREAALEHGAERICPAAPLPSTFAGEGGT